MVAEKANLKKKKSNKMAMKLKQNNDDAKRGTSTQDEK